MAEGQRSFVEKRKGDTSVNVLIGLGISFFGSPLLGGLAAGILQGEGPRAGARVGGIVGVVMGILTGGFLLLFVAFGVLGAVVGDDPGFLVFALFAVGIGLGAVVVNVVLTAGMGYLGGLLAE